MRTLAVWCPDWPVVAGGQTTGPAAVLHANRVVAANPAARVQGVVPGLRRREAQRRCPELGILPHDPARDARAFDPVVAALEGLTPWLEVGEPGRVAFPTRGPSRRCGGDEALAERVRDTVLGVLPAGAGMGVGVGDTPFTAWQAAARSVALGAAVVVPRGAAAAFLAPLPIETCGVPHLADLCRRLGLPTLGALAGLPAADVLARFGPEGMLAHRRASGRDDAPLRTRRPPDDLTVVIELDPPAERVEQVAFAVRGPVAALCDDLARRGLACTRVACHAETEHGEHHVRVWRAEGAFTPAAMVERVRWQLDGWLQAGPAGAPTAGISLVRVIPDEVIPDRGVQSGFWGGRTEADDRAARGVARVAGLLGREAVLVPVWRGGRGPAEHLVLVPADTVDLAARATGAVPVLPPAPPPWPGRVPPPSPALVGEPVSCEVVAADGMTVRVSGRGCISAAPARMRVAGGPWRAVTGWAGPWLYDERWWDAGARRRRARCQVVTEDGAAHLLAVEGGRWWREAVYD